MNNLGKAGAILVIIGGAIMSIGGIILLSAAASPLLLVTGPVFIILAIIILLLGVANIVLASLSLAGKDNFIIATGIVAIISILIGWVAYVIPTILCLVGGILLFCGKQKETITEEEPVTATKVEELLEV